MSSHTPGPWTAKPFGVIVGGEAHQYTNGRAQSQIAMVAILQNSNAADVGVEREANARLIAAAPELLEALLLALPWIETCEEGDEATRIGWAAVAKATGATP